MRYIIYVYVKYERQHKKHGKYNIITILYNSLCVNSWGEIVVHHRVQGVCKKQVCLSNQWCVNLSKNEGQIYFKEK